MSSASRSRQTPALSPVRTATSLTAILLVDGPRAPGLRGHRQRSVWDRRVCIHRGLPPESAAQDNAASAEYEETGEHQGDADGLIDAERVDTGPGDLRRGEAGGDDECAGGEQHIAAVSYTHLTLPTNREV